MNLSTFAARRTLLAVLALSLAGPALAQGDPRGGRPDGADRIDRPDRNPRAERGDRADRGHREPDRGRPGPRDDSWWDGAHGHNRRYTPPGRVVVLPPRPPAPVWWGGVGYRYWDGVWATSGPRGWITVRPPLGIWVHDLPGWRTALVIGGAAYFYANGVYYRERSEGGYEVVFVDVDVAGRVGVGRHLVAHDRTVRRLGRHSLVDGHRAVGFADRLGGAGDDAAVVGALDVHLLDDCGAVGHLDGVERLRAVGLELFALIGRPLWSLHRHLPLLVTLVS